MPCTSQTVFICCFVLKEQCLSVLLHTTWFETIAVFSKTSILGILQSSGGWQDWSWKRSHSISHTIIHHFRGGVNSTRGYFLGYNTVADLFSHNTVSSEVAGHIHKCADYLKCQIADYAFSSRWPFVSTIAKKQKAFMQRNWKMDCLEECAPQKDNIS